MKKSPHEIVQRTRGRDNGGADNDLLFGEAGNDVGWLLEMTHLITNSGVVVRMRRAANDDMERMAA